jgi:DNA-binding response OmpR family regulator
VTAAPSNVKALRPMRVLLVTDDDRFADRVTAAAQQQGLPIARASTGDDLDETADATTPNVVALDARTKLGRAARAATAFASVHPSIAVVVVARKASPRTLAGLRLVDEWSPPERLIDELNAAHLGLMH